MNRMRLRYLSIVTAVLIALATIAALTPAKASAAARGLYQAGWLRAGTSICRCPTTTGDCVCELKY